MKFLAKNIIKITSVTLLAAIAVFGSLKIIYGDINRLCYYLIFFLAGIYLGLEAMKWAIKELNRAGLH